MQLNILNKYRIVFILAVKRMVSYFPLLPLYTKYRLLIDDYAPFSKFNKILFELIILYKPKIVVELGTGEGNCMCVISLALRKNGFGKLFSFDSYGERIQNFIPKSGKSIEYKKNILGLKEYVENIKCDIFTYNWSDSAIDFMVIDIDNTFDRLKQIVDSWLNKVSENGIIIFEGGFSRYENKSRGINLFCQYLRDNGWETFTFKHYPGAVMARKIIDEDYSF
jgi:hypothetical protein